MAVSPNFAFLGVHDAQLAEIATEAEEQYFRYPVTCLIMLRQFGEFLAQLVAANVGLYTNPNESQLDLLNRLQYQNLLPGDVENLFHQLRTSGNDAVHNRRGNHGLALSHLRYARELGIWFHRTFGGDSNFKPEAFIPPADPVDETKALEAKLERLIEEAEAIRNKAELAEFKVIEEAKSRQIAEQLLEETEAQLEEAKAQFERRLETIQSNTSSQSSKLIQQTVSAANEAEQQIDLDENDPFTDNETQSTSDSLAPQDNKQSFLSYQDTQKSELRKQYEKECVIQKAKERRRKTTEEYQLEKQQKENQLRNGLSIGIGVTGLMLMLASGAGLLIGMPMVAGVVYNNLVHHKAIEPIDFKKVAKQVIKQVIKLSIKTIQVAKTLTKQLIKLAKKVIKLVKKQLIALCISIIKHLED